MSDVEFNKPWSPEAQAYNKTISQPTTKHNLLSFGIALCEGILNSLQNVYIDDDKPIYSGGAAEGTLTVQSSVVEVEECRLYKGDFTQGQCPILQEINTDSVHPAYRGVSYISFKNWNLKENTSMPNISFVVQCKPTRYSVLIGNDCNPVGIIADILVDYIKIPVTSIDWDNFDDISDVMISEGLGLSMIFETQNDAWKFIEEVCNHIDGLLYFDTTASKFKIKLIRNDYTVSTLPVYDEEDLQNFSFTRTSWNKIPNMFTLTYTDGTGAQPKFKSTSITIINAAARASNNGIVVQDKVSLLGITQPEVAQKALERLIIKKCYPYAEIRFRLFYEDDFALNIGDVIKLNYAPYNLTGLVVRVLDIQICEEDKGYLEIYCLEDAFATAKVTAIEPEQTLYVPPIYTVDNITSYNVLESPAHYSDYRAIFVIPKKPSTYATEFYVFYSENNVDFLQLAKQSFGYQGTIDAPGYSATTDDFDTVSGGFTVTNIYGLENLTSYTDEKSAQARPYQAILGTEFIAFGKITDLTGGKYLIENICRAEHYSTKVAHASGELFYILNKPFDIIPITIAKQNTFYIKAISKSHFENSPNETYFGTAITKTVNFTSKYKMTNTPYEFVGTHVGTTVSLHWNFNATSGGADYNKNAMDDAYFAANDSIAPANTFFEITYTNDSSVVTIVTTQATDLVLTQTNVHTYSLRANVYGVYTSAVTVTI